MDVVEVLTIYAIGDGTWALVWWLTGWAKILHTIFNTMSSVYHLQSLTWLSNPRPISDQPPVLRSRQ